MGARGSEGWFAGVPLVLLLFTIDMVFVVVPPEEEAPVAGVLAIC